MSRVLQTLTAAVTAADQGDGHPPVNPYADFLLRVAEKFGVPTVLLLLVLWWMKTGIVQPLLDAHFEVVGKIVRGQEQHTEAIAAVGEKLDELISLSRHATKATPSK